MAGYEGEGGVGWLWLLLCTGKAADGFREGDVGSDVCSSKRGGGGEGGGGMGEEGREGEGMEEEGMEEEGMGKMRRRNKMKVRRKKRIGGTVEERDTIVLASLPAQGDRQVLVLRR